MEMLFKRGKAKRLLSSIVAICLMLSIVPMQGFTATADGVAEGTQPMAIAASVTPLHYNFFKMHIGQPNWNSGTDITTIRDFGMTTKNDPKEINKTIASDPWIYVDTEGDAQMPYIDTAYACMLYGKIGTWVRLKVRVPTAGVYQATATNGFYGSGGKIRIYLTPDKTGVDPMSTQYIMGEIDTYSDKTNWSKDTPMRNIQIEAGDYYLTYEKIEKNPKSGSEDTAVGGFKLLPPTAEQLNISCENIGICSPNINISRELLVDINGVPTDFKNAKEISVSSKDNDIATATVRREDVSGKAYLDIKPIAIGKTTLDVKVVKDEKTVQASFPIKVYGPKELTTITFAAEKNKLNLMETTSTEVEAWTADGTKLNVANDVTITYQSSDNRVATVDNMGNIIGKMAGKARITAVVKKDQKSLSKTLEVEVDDFTPVKSAEITGVRNVVENSTLQLGVKGVRESGGIADLSKAQVSYELVSATPENAATVSASGLVTAQLAGSVTVKAKVTLDTAQTIETQPVTIQILQEATKDITFDFTTYANSGNSPGDIAITNTGWQVNQSKTASDAMLSFEKTGLTVIMPKANAVTASDATLDFNVGKESAYALDISGVQAAKGTTVDIYIDEIYMGQYNFGGNNTKPSTMLLNSLKLTQGIHTITFRRVGAGEGNSFYIGKVTLRAQALVAEFTGIRSKVDKAVLSVGESAKLSANVLMSNTRVLFMGPLFNGQADGKNQITFSNDTPNLISLAADGTIQALAPGEANIKVTAVVNGTVHSANYSITVDSQKLSILEAGLSSKRVNIGSNADIQIVAKTENGRLIDNKDIQITCTSENENIATVSGTVLTAVAVGNTKVKIAATLNGVRKEFTIDVEVYDQKQPYLRLYADQSMMKPDDKGAQLKVQAFDAENNEIKLNDVPVTYINNNQDVVAISPTGFVVPLTVGNAVIEATVKINDKALTGKFTITVTQAKTQSTYFKPDIIDAARENAAKYPWAKSVKDAAVAKADRYLDLTDTMWEFVTTQELPRGCTIGYRYDVDAYNCRHCGENLRNEWGYYPWKMDHFNSPWKLQCPNCRRKFPSNDFESFYKLGIKEDGMWSYELAKQKNAELVANGEKGYLVNELYPEMDKDGVKNWGVDDGYGYKTGKKSSDGKVEQVHTYVAYYNHFGLWDGSYDSIVNCALTNLTNAYIYTGDARYGRVGAILLDRVADVYPDMKIAPYFPHFYNSDGSQPKGKVVGAIWETDLANVVSQAYDAFYPMYDDTQVISYLSSRAKQYNMKNPKTTAQQIRQNCEDGLLRQIRDAVKTQNIHGNFGMHQRSMAYAAVVLDNPLETREMIDWIFQAETVVNGISKGGNLLHQLMGIVNRDGIGNESALGYNASWISSILKMAEVLGRYGKYEKGDLFNNPKFVKMFSAMLPLVICQRTVPQIADYGSVGSVGLTFYPIGDAIKGYDYTKDIRIAQLIYLMNGMSTENLRGDIFTKDPEDVGKEIQKVIDQYGPYHFGSDQLTAYGCSILRDGEYYPSSYKPDTVDTQRDFWMNYTTTQKHGHNAALNLGMEAYGHNFAPDFGYPEVVDGGDLYRNWATNTASHNTVMVNDKRQGEVTFNNLPKHFDDSGLVKVMEVDASSVYSETSIFKRTIVMVEANDDVSYGIDFFRVKGGNEHLYSFHAMSDEIDKVEGLNFVEQKTGSYAGVDVPWKKLGISNGYSYLHNVRRAQHPGSGEFSLNFKIKDFKKTLPYPMDLNLRMTMLNGFDLSEVALASGEPPQIGNNPKSIEFVLARRSGKNLDTLFTTVLEPYKEERYIKNMERVEVIRVGGAAAGENDVAKAIKVTLTNGRVDYIVYASNNAIEYRIDNLFNFKGFIGVHTVKDNMEIYNYMNDGEKIGTLSGVSAYSGKVVDYTKDLAFKNSLTVQFDNQVDVDRLPGQYIYINNDGSQNAVYPICGATSKDGRTVTLDLGDLTLIREFKSATDVNAGYIYNIAAGQTFHIPLSSVSDTSPVFNMIEEKTAEAGSELKFQVSAKSPIGKALTYSAGSLPRGAQFNAETQTFSWNPDSSQRGQAHASFNVTDGTFTSTQHVSIKVYNPSQQGGDSKIDNPWQPPKIKPGSNGEEVTGNEEIKNVIDVATKLDSHTKVATSTIEKAQLDKILNSDKSLASINIKEEKGANAYAVKLPTSSLTNNSINKEIAIHTTSCSVILPTEMMANDAELVASKNSVVTITIKSVKNGVNISVRVDGKDYNWENASSPIKISNDFTPLDGMKDANCIIVKDSVGNIVPNGKYEDGKVSMFVTKLSTGYTFEYNPKEFKDLESHMWANDAITRLAARGIINGTSKNEYSPKKNITRADFTTLVIRAFGFKAETNEGFNDVAADAYYTQEVNTAKALGIVNGQANDKFNPNSSISREDMMVIVARAAEKAKFHLNGEKSRTFTDTDSVSDYAKDAVKKLAASGIVAGNNNNINPKGTSTRAEVAVILDRLVFYTR